MTNYPYKFRILIVLFSSLISGCESTKKSQLLESPVKVKLHQGDSISTQAAVNLALSSYVSGCVKAKRSERPGKYFEECMKLGNSYIESNVLYFLEQTNRKHN